MPRGLFDVDRFLNVDGAGGYNYVILAWFPIFRFDCVFMFSFYQFGIGMISQKIITENS
jgi:hypothetical protein